MYVTVVVVCGDKVKKPQSRPNSKIKKYKIQIYINTKKCVLLLTYELKNCKHVHKKHEI